MHFQKKTKSKFSANITVMQNDTNVDKTVASNTKQYLQCYEHKHGDEDGKYINTGLITQMDEIISNNVCPVE